MPSLKDLREKAGKIAADMRKLSNLATEGEGRAFTADEKNAWEKLDKDFEAVKALIEVAKRAEDVEAQTQAPSGDPHVGRGDTRPAGEEREDEPTRPTEEDRALALQAYFRAGTELGLTRRHREACRKIHFNPNQRVISMRLGFSPMDTHRRMARCFRSGDPGAVLERAETIQRERRDLSAATGSAGGFVSPEVFVNRLEINMLAFGGMEQTSEVMPTENGNPMPWPAVDDTGNTGEQVGENSNAGGTKADPTFKQIQFLAYKFSSKLVLVPTELLEDAAFDMATMLGNMLGERLGRIGNTKFTTGSGAATPKGLLTAASLGVTAASTTAFTDAELKGLVHSVDPAYRTVDCGWQMHDNTLLALKTMNDGIGRPLYPELQLPGAPRLHGYPITVNQDLASSLTAAGKPIVFGQLSKSKIRRVRGIRLKRLDERYADYDQVAFIAFIRQDGNLIDAGTAPVKYLQLHA